MFLVGCFPLLPPGGAKESKMEALTESLMRAANTTSWLPIQGSNILTGAGIISVYSLASEEDLCWLDLVLGSSSTERISVIHSSPPSRSLVWGPWSMSTSWSPAEHRHTVFGVKTNSLTPPKYPNTSVFSAQVMMTTEVLHVERLFISLCHPHVLYIHPTPSTGLHNHPLAARKSIWLKQFNATKSLN